MTDARNFYLRARRETNLPSLSFAGKDKFSFSGFLDVEDTMVVLNQRRIMEPSVRHHVSLGRHIFQCLFGRRVISPQHAILPVEISSGPGPPC